MRVCMISPHLPPEQSANALLPAMLGDALASHGVFAKYVSHPPSDGAASEREAQVTYVPRRARGTFSRSRVGAVIAGTRMALGASGSVRSSDLIHLHSNGFIIEIGGWLARGYRKPFVVTLYGTDISHYDPTRDKRFGGVVRAAASRVFYSRGLLEHARHLGLAPEPSKVIYAPVGSAFVPTDEQARRALRRELGIGDEPVLLTVKRLHPVAGHETLLRAMPAILGNYPQTRLWIAGEGELRSQLERRTQELGIQSHVRFLGRLQNASLRRYYAAADLFVLPSQVESWGTVMLEALACGTPVVTTDTIGGVEVGDNFPDDVQVVRKAMPEDLASAVCVALRERRRTTADACDRIRASFGMESCARQYLDVYRIATSCGPQPSNG
jgi:glycosyltransferase involved in cell wall biosynthesis